MPGVNQFIVDEVANYNNEFKRQGNALRMNVTYNTEKQEVKLELRDRNKTVYVQNFPQTGIHTDELTRIMNEFMTGCILHYRMKTELTKSVG